MGGQFLIYSLTGDNPQPMGNESNFTSPRNSFQTQEGKWVAFSASAQAPFERMMDLMGHSELKTTPGFRNNQERLQNESRKVLNRIIGNGSGQDPEGGPGRMRESGSAIGPVNTMEDIARSPCAREEPGFSVMTRPRGAFPSRAPVRFLKTPVRSGFPGFPWGRPMK
jgi:crotonobetainyl-CoA:carnitine CoA-transferase CaiB-like acyl-CoA transferase